MDDYLDDVERQLAALTERGAHRRLRARLLRADGPAPGSRRRPGARRERVERGGSGRPPRRRSDMIAIASAVLVTVAVAAVVLSAGIGSDHASRTSGASHSTSTPSTTGHRGRHPRSHGRSGGAGLSGTTTSASTTQTVATTGPAGPVPAGFGPESFTAIGEEMWWLLGTAPCSSPPCTSIVRTDDGGRTFVGVPAPRTAAVTQLRFADPSDGFAYNTQLWVTHDGGATWAQADVGGAVTDLEISGGYAYAVERSSNGVGRLLRSPVHGGPWTVLPGAGDAFTGLWAHGSDVLLEGSSSAGAGDELLVSHDSGATFARHAPPPNVACGFEEPAAAVIWAHCATGMLSGVWRSTTDGQSWVPSGTPTSQGSLPQMPNSASFGAASATSAVVGYKQLYLTTDGGTTYSKVSGPSDITWWQYLGFTDPTHGVALGYVGSQSAANERLYYTTDGGHSYHRVPIG